MKKRWKRNENGSTLVELMTAFLILLLVAEAMLLSVSGYSKTVKRYREIYEAGNRLERHMGDTEYGEPAEIHLAAGLPLTSFGREKNAFRDYLLRDGRTVSFRYEGQEYSITIRKVSLFPQGYAAVLTQSILLDEPSVIVADIGGWTVDLMRLDNRIPNASTCRSLELGMIRCLDEIGEQIRPVYDGGTDGKRAARRCCPYQRGCQKNY